MTTPKKTIRTEADKEAARAAKIALTPEFEKVFGKTPTNFQNAEKMRELIDEYYKCNANAQSQSSENSAQSQIFSSGENGIAAEESASSESGIQGAESGIEPAVSAEVKVAGISVVIPYLASAAKGEELKYALRSWAQHFPEAQIVIIGDKPDFISDQVIHISQLIKHSQPQLDVAIKLMQAIGSDQVTEEFIWSNDDIYLINPVCLEDIALLKSVGQLGKTKKNASNGYKEIIVKTVEALKRASYRIHDYSTHTPFLYKKEKMAKVIDKYGPDTRPLLISSLYFNSVFPKETPVLINGGKECEVVGYIYRSNPDLNILAQAFQERKFINHNNDGYESVLPFLEELFPDKCKYEL